MNSPHPLLDPTRIVVARPDGHVQLGIDPERAVLIRPPAPLDSADLHRVLSRLDGTVDLARLCTRLAVPEAPVAHVVAALARARLLVARTADRSDPARRILLLGAGALADQLAGALTGHGAVLERNHRPDRPAVERWAGGLVVLVDQVTGHRQLLADLHTHRVPHLAVRLRDGVGVVGPLVLPGRTSCLRCADLHRTDRDPAWPQLLHQQQRRPGHGDPATVLATAGTAVSETDRYRRWSSGSPGAVRPVTVDHTVEVDLARPAILGRHWTPHRACPCGAAGRPGNTAEQRTAMLTGPESGTMASCPRYPAAASPAPPVWPHSHSASPAAPPPDWGGG